MMKNRRKIISILSATALSLTAAAAVSAQKNAQLTKVSADEPAQTVVAELISPTSYEQYLSLTAPTDVTATEGYTAITDGNSLHVFDRAENLYRTYTHTERINAVRFDNAGNVYFLSALRLYVLPMDSLKSGAPQATDMGIACTTFTVENDVVYYANSFTHINTYSLTEGMEGKTIPLPGILQSDSPLAFGKNGLYCVCENAENNTLYTVYTIDVETENYMPLAVFSKKIDSITIANNLFCVVTKESFSSEEGNTSQKGAFYAYNLTDLSANDSLADVTAITDTKQDETDVNGYGSIYAFDGSVYAIRGNIIRHYSVEETAFTDFEIGTASASAHRLNGATDVLLSENKLFIADDGNDRISVYNTETFTFEQAIPSTVESPFMASYGKTLLVSSSTESILYSLSSKTYGEPLLTIPDEELDGKVIGVASVYDHYYVLTDLNYCYTMFREDGSDWQYEETKKSTVALRATAFTADVYGSLYVAYDNGTIYRFTERELTTGDAGGTKILEGLTAKKVDKFSLDYASNLYVLANGVMTKYTENLETGTYTQSESYTPSYGLVRDETPYLASFAFGVKTQYTYFLYENHYVVKSNELQIPIVSPIPVGDAANRVFGAENRDFSLITVEDDAILIQFDIAALQGATEFPYVAFERCEGEMTALKIGEEFGYSIISVLKENTNKYRTYLVLNSSCTAMQESEYVTAYEEGGKVGYLTNNVSLYKFPTRNPLLTVCELPRGVKVTLLGEIHQLEHDYYAVSYVDENGATQIGFIPKTYANQFDGSTPTPETHTIGSTEDDHDSVWRFAYIVLGLGAIGILVDYLLLRKKKEE